MADQAVIAATSLTETDFEKQSINPENKKTFTRNLRIAKVIDVSFSKVKININY